jgi:hypothetical protein
MYALIVVAAMTPVLIGIAMIVGIRQAKERC